MFFSSSHCFYFQHVGRFRVAFVRTIVGMSRSLSCVDVVSGKMNLEGYQRSERGLVNRKLEVVFFGEDEMLLKRRCF